MLPTVDFKESRTRVVRFPEVEAPVLEKVCQYMYHRQRAKAQTTVSSKGGLKQKVFRRSDDVESFDVEPDMLVKVLLFASFLDL